MHPLYGIIFMSEPLSIMIPRELVTFGTPREVGHVLCEALGGFLVTQAKVQVIGLQLSLGQLFVKLSENVGPSGSICVS